MNGENRPIGPAPLPDNTPPTPPPGGQTPPPPPPTTLPAGPPPPPPPQIDIRTMASDAESLKSTGGMSAEPKTFSPADLAKEPVFGAEIVSPAATSTAPRAESGKKLALALGAVAVLAAAAAVGYFFVWPLFTGTQEEEVVVTPPQPLPAPTPAPAPAHQGYFKAAPSGGTKSVSLSSLTLSGLTAAFKATSTEATSTAVLKEVTLTSEGKSFTSTQVLGLILPGSGLETYVEGDVTAFVYYANGKSYPGYVFKLKSSADKTAAQTAASSIEKSANLAGLYPESPGAAKGGWKDGSVGSAKTRYQAYSSASASLNYGWANNYLVISTSYEGFKKAVELLK